VAQCLGAHPLAPGHTLRYVLQEIMQGSPPVSTTNKLIRDRLIFCRPKCGIISLIRHLGSCQNDPLDTATDIRKCAGRPHRRTTPASGRRPRERPVREHPQELREPVREIQDLVRAGGLLSASGTTRGPGRVCRGTSDDGKSMSTIRLAVAAIVDTHRRVGLESPQTAGVTETLRGLSRQLGVSQKQARPLDADALAAIRATALNPRSSRGGSLETVETALRRGRLDIALASVMSDAGLRISEAAALRWLDVLDAEGGAGLIYIERSKTDQAGEGAYVVVTPETLTALKQLREDAGDCSDDDPVFGLSMSQICRRLDSMARAAGLGEGYSGHSGRVGLAIRMTRRGAPLQAVQTHGRWKSPSMPARYTRSEKALEALEWLV